MKYLFNGIELDLKSDTPIMVNGKASPVEGYKPVKLLQYLLDNNGKIKSLDDIIANVWGKDKINQTSNDAVNTACVRANKALAGICRIECIRHRGYRIDVELTKIEPKEDPSVVVYEKMHINKLAILLCVICLAFIAGNIYNRYTPSSMPPVYTLKELQDVFVHNRAVGRPQISPAGTHIIYRLSEQLGADSFLAITEVATSKMQRLAPIHRDEGFRWSLSGEQIVYQSRAGKACEIRLIELNTNKQLIDDQLLATCPQNSGALSFTWLNEQQFYFNGVDKQAPGLPLHQLYLLNIKDKTSKKVINTAREGGVGFYSLEYDVASSSLHMLKINKNYTTDVYRYHNGQLEKLATINQLLASYSLYKGQFIYVNNHNDIVQSDIASKLTTTKVVMPSTKVPTSAPYIAANKLAYIQGHQYSYALHKLVGNNIEQVPLAGYIPKVIAKHNNGLVFTSKQTGINQIYKLGSDGKVEQISDFNQDAAITHIAVLQNLFAVSFINRIEFYRFTPPNKVQGSRDLSDLQSDKQAQLTYVNTLTGYSNGVIAPSGTTMLARDATNHNNQKPPRIIELQLADFEPTGIVLDNAQLALYRNNAMVYVNHKQQLVEFYHGKHKLLADNVRLSSINKAAQTDNLLYYINTASKQLMVYDFTQQSQTKVPTHGVNPTQITAINGRVYIRTRQPIAPKLMLGELIEN